MAEITLKTTNSSSWIETIKEKRLDDEVVNLVVDAYSKGISHGLEQAKSFEHKTIIKAFQENLEKATSIGSKTAEQIVKDFSTEIEGLFLKVENKANFTIAILLPLNFYLSKNRRKLTNRLIEIENENCSDTFEISFTVIPNKESLDLHKLFIDGYILSNEKYQRRSKKA